MHTVQLIQKEKFRACGVLCTTVHIEGVDIHFTVQYIKFAQWHIGRGGGGIVGNSKTNLLKTCFYVNPIVLI